MNQTKRQKHVKERYVGKGVFQETQLYTVDHFRVRGGGQVSPTTLKFTPNLEEHLEDLLMNKNVQFQC